VRQYSVGIDTSAERRAWEVLSKLPTGSVTRDDLRLRRVAIDQAEVVTAFAPVSEAAAEDSPT